MAKIVTYPSASLPLSLNDILIGTDVNDNNNTKNFSLGELLNLFSASFPASSLQGVLDNNNTATQDINLTGTIFTTNVKPTNIIDTTNSSGIVGQVLIKSAGGILWSSSGIGTQNLQSVLNAGNIAIQDINLAGNIYVTGAIKPTNITDAGSSNGTAGQFLGKNVSGLVWTSVPADTLSAVLTAGNSATNNMTIVGQITATTLKSTNINDITNSNGTTGQFLSKGASGITWASVPAATLSAVLSAGNTATNNMTITGQITATTLKSTNINDITNSNGTTGQFLSRAAGGITWASVPADTLSAVLAAGNTASANMTINGLITATTIKPTDITDVTTSNGSVGQVLTKGASGIIWSNPTGAVTQIIAGTNITISPAGGTGAVTINSTAVSAPGGSNANVQFNNSGAFGGDSNFNWDNTNKRLGIGTATPLFNLHVNGTVYSSSNLSVSTVGSTTGSPRIVGLVDFSTGRAGRFQFGDLNNAIQNSFGGRMILNSYWGMQIYGSGRGTPPSFSAGTAVDPSLEVFGTNAENHVLAVTGALGQTGNLQEWRYSNGYPSAVVSPIGDLGLNTSSPSYKLHVNGSVGFTALSNSPQANVVGINIATGQLSYQAAGGGGGSTPIVLPVPNVSLGLAAGSVNIQCLDNTNGYDYEELFLTKPPFVIATDLSQTMLSSYSVYVEMVHYKRRNKKIKDGNRTLKGSKYAVEPSLIFDEGNQVWNVDWPQTFWTRSNSPHWTPQNQGIVPVYINRPNWYQVTTSNQAIPVWQYLNSRFYNRNIQYRDENAVIQNLNVNVPVYGSKSTMKDRVTSRFAYSSVYTPLYVAFRYVLWNPNGGPINPSTELPYGEILSGPLSRVVKITNSQFPFNYDYAASSLYGVPCVLQSGDFDRQYFTCMFETKLP